MTPTCRLVAKAVMKAVVYLTLCTVIMCVHMTVCNCILCVWVCICVSVCVFGGGVGALFVQWPHTIEAHQKEVNNSCQKVVYLAY